MKPYYQTQLGTLYHGDWMEGTQKIENESVDLVLTDPPYGLNYNQNDMASCWEAIFKGKESGPPRPIQGDDRADFVQGLDVWFKEFRRLLNSGSCCCCCCCGGGGPKPIFAEMALAMDRDLEFLQAVVWVKPGLGMGLRYRRSYEFMLIAKKPGAALRWNEDYANKRASNVVDFPKILPSVHQHPTQKPEALISHFLMLHSFEGDMVLEPFAGSGTTCVVAERLNRRWVAFETDEQFCEMAAQRIDTEAKQLAFF